ncbi:hypothetical protein GCM10009555_001800 [Acrocarpospora macrocephala]|uniref:HTH gntR-type domain-containing protein n=1 Tax=Acrocarpospora macrocephala TaxID=150177 RepID=A0A5M3XAT9_9ACTN|nr:hypothetical protein Amac_102190 [Acrocarpospora macrocephala]
MPSEPELVRNYDVSRPTIRKAIETLVSEGLRPVAARTARAWSSGHSRRTYSMRTFTKEGHSEQMGTYPT